MHLVVRLYAEKCKTSRLKRLYVEAIMDTIHRHFNVSIAEIGPEKPHDELILAACCVGRSKAAVLDVLERVAEALCAYPDAVPVARPEYASR